MEMLLERLNRKSGHGKLNLPAPSKSMSLKTADGHVLYVIEFLDGMDLDSYVHNMATTCGKVLASFVKPATHWRGA